MFKYTGNHFLDSYRCSYTIKELLELSWNKQRDRFIIGEISKKRRWLVNCHLPRRRLAVWWILSPGMRYSNVYTFLFRRCFRHWTRASRQLEKSPSSSIFSSVINTSIARRKKNDVWMGTTRSLSLFLFFIYLFFLLCVWLCGLFLLLVEDKQRMWLLFIFRQLIPVFQGIVSFFFFANQMLDYGA